jgi:membrane glycosyltransferase
MSFADRLRLSPPLNRAVIIPPGINTSWKHSIWNQLFGRRGNGRVIPGWEKVVIYRQRVSLAMTLILTSLCIMLSDYSLRAQQMSEFALEVYLVVYGVMSFFLISNFSKMLIGTWHTLRGPSKNPWHPSHTARDPRPHVRVAVVFPVYHEGIPRVTAGIAATWMSIRDKYPHLADRFDFFLVSDSRKASYAIAEEAAVHRLRDEFPDGRFYYRRRTSNINAKMGNVSDFCRRWGKNWFLAIWRGWLAAQAGSPRASLPVSR